jgi:hypothetical protein
MTYVRVREMMDVQFHLGSLDEKNGGMNFTCSSGLWLGCCFAFGHSGQGIGLVEAIVPNFSSRPPMKGFL